MLNDMVRDDHPEKLPVNVPLFPSIMRISLYVPVQLGEPKTYINIRDHGKGSMILKYHGETAFTRVVIARGSWTNGIGNPKSNQTRDKHLTNPRTGA